MLRSGDEGEGDGEVPEGEYVPSSEDPSIKLRTLDTRFESALKKKEEYEANMKAREIQEAKWADYYAESKARRAEEAAEGERKKVEAALAKEARTKYSYVFSLG